MTDVNGWMWLPIPLARFRGMVKIETVNIFEKYADIKSPVRSLFFSFAGRLGIMVLTYANMIVRG